MSILIFYGVNYYYSQLNEEGYNKLFYGVDIIFLKKSGSKNCNCYLFAGGARTAR